MLYEGEEEVEGKEGRKGFEVEGGEGVVDMELGGDEEAPFIKGSSASISSPLKGSDED